MEKLFVTEDGQRLEATGETLEAILSVRAEAEKEKLQKEEKAKAKESLLQRLGITSEEAKLLVS